MNRPSAVRQTGAPTAGPNPIPQNPRAVAEPRSDGGGAPRGLLEGTSMSDPSPLPTAAAKDKRQARGNDEERPGLFEREPPILVQEQQDPDDQKPLAAARPSPPHLPARAGRIGDGDG